MNSTDKQILNLIKARYPIIVVESHEENRVCEAIDEIAFNLDVMGEQTQVFHWDFAGGLSQVVPAPKKNENNPIAKRNPAAILEHIQAFGQPAGELPAGPRAVFVLKDYHHFTKDVAVLRLLRNTANALVARHQTIILLAPRFEIPADLEKQLTVVSYPLPDQGALAEQLDRFIDQLPGRIPVTLNGDRATVARALQGLTRSEADSVLAQAVIETGEMGLGAIDFIVKEKAAIIRKSGRLEYWPEQASYADVGGLDLLKAWVRQAMAAFSPAAAEYGIEPPRGFLAVGVPGSGKSLLAKAVAGGTMPLVRLDVGALMGSLVGESEANTRAALKTIEAVAPCVLWIDEVEKALGGGGEQDGGTSMRVLGTLLTWLQETTAQVFVTATANDITHLRPELIRRFEEVFFCDLPHEQERVEIFQIHLRKRGRDPEAFDLAALAKLTEGYTGAEIERVVKTALRAAFADGAREMGAADLELAVQQIVPLSVTMTKQIDEMRDWAGRARPASSKQASGHQAAPNRRALMFS
ncbi:MAG: AAA family ATPase [Anaerolineae bacterium]|nr:AAA family ATPase [Anaerolineae bacterium]